MSFGRREAAAWCSDPCLEIRSRLLTSCKAGTKQSFPPEPLHAIESSVHCCACRYSQSLSCSSELLVVQVLTLRAVNNRCGEMEEKKARERERSPHVT